MKIIMLGAPGAGKGTQAKKIAEKYSVPHISTGDIFRANIKNNTELGQKAKTYMDKGELVPDELVVDLIMDRFKEADCANGYVLDGFPRNYDQAVSLDELLLKHNMKINAVINLDVKEDILRKRIVGRLLCPNCNAIYNDQIENMNSKEKGVCDICHSVLIKRDDDNIDTFNNRYNTYIKETRPLIDYYERKNILYTVNSENSANNVFKSIENIIDNI